MAQKIKTMLAEANAEVETIPAAAAMALLNDANVCFIDIRDSAELEREGKIPGAIHVPRGSLEFQVDPESPMHKQIFSSKKKFVFYWAGGGRSALAAQGMKAMGLEPVAHLGGGINAWKAAGGAVEGVGTGAYATKLSEVHKLLLSVTTPERQTEEEGWSVKQVVGHLLDSCSNNHQRLCRSIPGGELSFPAYDQNGFMQTANYATYDYGKLVQLWFAHNQLLLHIYESMEPAVAAQTRVKVGERPAVTVPELIRDYFGHMDAHVAQIKQALG